MTLPTAYSWTLIGLPGGGAPAGGGAAPPLPCPITAFTQQDILDLFDRLLPEHYLAPLKSPGPGYEALQAFAAVMARASTAVARLGCASFVLSSPSGGFATGTVELYRGQAHPEAISVIVKAGTVVSCGLGGQRFVTTADATFGPADLGPFTVAVRSEAQGFEYNVTGEVVAADGTALEGEIDTVDMLVEDPEVGDTTILVRQTGADTSGGKDAALDQHGIDRGIYRGLSETDDEYRARVRSLPDNISPSAFYRAVQRFCFPLNAAHQYIETWDASYQTCYDGPGDFIAGSDYDPNLFCYDDPRPASPFRNRWLDENDHRGGVIVVVENVCAISEVGMAYDDTAMDGDALVTPLGSRAICAYDVTSSLPSTILHGGYDGFDLLKRRLYAGLYQTMLDIKAAGVTVALELQGE